jgi:hypothetical protein
MAVPAVEFSAKTIAAASPQQFEVHHVKPFKQRRKVRDDQRISQARADPQCHNRLREFPSVKSSRLRLMSHELLLCLVSEREASSLPLPTARGVPARLTHPSGLIS